MSNLSDWPALWRELRHNLEKLSYVRTLDLGVLNEIIEVRETGVRLLSQQSRSNAPRLIKEGTFKAWCEHLLQNRTASLVPGNPNNPRSSHSRIVGAILVTCLPDKVRVVDPDKADTIELIGA